MSFAVVHSRALDALQAQAVTVEVHLANGLPSLTLVGLADTEVKESRQSMPNAAIDAGRIDEWCQPDAAAARFAQSAAQRMNWSSRGLHRALKVARTIADLAGAERIATVHVAEALQLRRSLTS
jgi:magnesium chelatase family protein